VLTAALPRAADSLLIVVLRGEEVQLFVHRVSQPSKYCFWSPAFVTL